VQALLKDETWFADVDAPLDDGLGFDDCPSPTLFLGDRPAAFLDDRTEEAEAAHDTPDAAVESATAVAHKLTGSVDVGSTPRSGIGRSRVEGGIHLSPRGSFERAASGSKKKKERGTAAREPSDMLKGLLNSKDMEDRLASAQTRLHPNLRLMIPSPNVGTVLELERPPSRQRNLPMHLNSDLSLELPSHDGQLSPDVERKWAHYASTPRPQSRHKSPPDAVFLDLPPEPLQGDRDPQPLPPDSYVTDAEGTGSSASAAVISDASVGASGTASLLGIELSLLPPPPQLLSTPMTMTSAPVAPRRPQSGAQPVIINGAGVGGGAGCSDNDGGASVAVGPTGVAPRNMATLGAGGLLDCNVESGTGAARDPSAAAPLLSEASRMLVPGLGREETHHPTVDRAALLAAAATPNGGLGLSVDAVEGTFERLEMHKPNPAQPISAPHMSCISGPGYLHHIPSSHAPEAGTASTVLQNATGGGSAGSYLGGDGDGTGGCNMIHLGSSGLWQTLQPTAPHRDSHVRMLSTTEPSTTEPSTHNWASCACSSAANAATLSRPQSGKPRNISSATGTPRTSSSGGSGGQSSHAHARAHQQQMKAVAAAAEAASTSFDSNGCPFVRPSSSHGSCSTGNCVGTPSGGPGTTPLPQPPVGPPPGNRSISGLPLTSTPTLTTNSCGDRMEVLPSSGLRPSTSESDASARGTKVAEAKQAKEALRVQKLDKLSAMYGGSGGSQGGSGGGAGAGLGGGSGVAISSEGRSSSRPKAGSAGVERGIGSCYSASSAYGASAMAAELRRTIGSNRTSRNGCSTAPTTVGANPRAAQREVVAPLSAVEAVGTIAGVGNDSSVCILRIPQELRPGATEEHTKSFTVSTGRYPADRGMASPLPFESSLAPDFLALFSQ